MCESLAGARLHEHVRAIVPTQRAFENRIGGTISIPPILASSLRVPGRGAGQGLAGNRRSTKTGWWSDAIVSTSTRPEPGTRPGASDSDVKM